MLVVHRPKYDDWSLPKGTVEPGETSLAAALREVREETGLCCRVIAELPEVRYTDHKGQPKRVRYWLMRVDSGTLEPNDEVDTFAWLSPGAAAARLSYAHDAALLDGVLAPGDGS